MIQVTPFEDLGRFRNGWLDAHYHFSFFTYYDPARMGLGPLRVWNDDVIQPGAGFDPHPHRDMEIVTYVRTGAITHRDNLGNEGRTGAGDVQVMSAGAGILHSEFNLESEATTLFQIWIEPNEMGVQPRWANRRFPKEGGARLDVLASGRARDQENGALPIYQDAAVLGGTLEAGQRAGYDLSGRKAYLVPARGVLEINGVQVPEQAGVAIEAEGDLDITATQDAEVVMVEAA